MTRLIAAFVLGWGIVLPVSCQESAPAPKDLEIVYGFGATHAEWGRTTYRLTADGVMTVEKTQGYGDEAKSESARYALTPEELGQILRKIEEARFFKLKESYADNRIRDGYSSFLSIRMNGKTHMVSVMNKSVKRFDLVAETLEKITAAKIKAEGEKK